MKYKLLLIAFMVVGLATTAMAQSGTVEGTVVDAVSGESLPGVNIVIDGTTTGTTTGMDGSFSINVEGPGTVLNFSFIGYSSISVTVTSSHLNDGLNIELQEDVAMLDEMVVVGFGTQRRADITGAVSTVPAVDIERRSVGNTALALQGASPGLTVQYQGGQPGEETANIRVRGTGTLNNPNPLVLVDGVEQSLASVEPSNIADITILKDAASAAIYGSRAANGVILITTKRGVDTGVVVSYNTYASIQNELGFPEGADDESWMRLRNEADVAAGGDPFFTEEYISNVLAGTNPFQYPWANWYEGAFRENALEHSHELSISTGGSSGRLYAAISHLDQEGIMQNFDSRRTSFRVNSDIYLTDNLTAQANLLYRDRRTTGPGFTGQRITQAILHMNRDAVMSYPDGIQGTGDLLFGQWNAHVMANSGETIRDSDDIVGTFGLKYDINDTFSLEGDLTINNITTNETVFRETRNGFINYVTGLPEPASGWFSTATLQEGSYARNEISQRAFLNYTDSFGAANVTGLVGYEEIYTKASQSSAARAGFFSNDLRLLSAGDSGNQRTCQAYNDPGNFTGGCFKDEWRVRSFFGRANFSYDNRYSVQANVRYDGSSRFAEGNRWGFFPSFSAGWRISSESFMQDVDLFSNLRLRASWGQLGNERISSNERAGLFNFMNNYNLGLAYQFNGQVVPAAAVTSAGNPNFSWETTTMRNIGLDMGFFDDQVEVIAEYFWNYTSDILLALPVPPSVGVSPPTQNAGEVSNKGWELGVRLRSAPGSVDSFQYNLGITLSDAVNKIESLSGEGPFYPDKFTVWTEGESINSLRGYRSPGIYRTQEDLDRYPAKISPNATIGDIIYEDLTGDGALTAALYPAGDHVIIGNEDPRFEFGINFGASYKGFDFSMFWQGVLEQYRLLDGALNEGPNWQNYIPAIMARERFHPTENPNGTWPRVITGNTWNLEETEFWFLDSKYMRLKNIQLGYTVPLQQYVQNLRIYVSGENLLTFTPNELYDPETPRGRSQFFPHAKKVSLGLNVTF
ncbi:MAG: TonB-dependent receptor [Balneolaceae bacterium]|nr:TonB-dependent receptor [Balneolaceae bacterium]